MPDFTVPTLLEGLPIVCNLEDENMIRVEVAFVGEGGRRTGHSQDSEDVGAW